MGQLYRFLGPRPSGSSSSEHDRPSERAAYGCDITYGTNNEFGFDYLRDNMAMRPRGHACSAATLTRSSTRSTRS
ncbi:MAG: hypothetical protein MZU97_06940 [Bacillus subtilis]|nr:hypothetical protein [Bacillus subtilis]